MTFLNIASYRISSSFPAEMKKQQKWPTARSLRAKGGRGGEIRTPDPLVPNQVR